jgi:hypothetical protein
LVKYPAQPHFSGRREIIAGGVSGRFCFKVFHAEIPRVLVGFWVIPPWTKQKRLFTFLIHE